MYRIAVCEDEPIFLKYISEMTVDILSSILPLWDWRVRCRRILVLMIF